MKKIQLFVLSVVVVLFTACHGNIWDAIDDLDARVARLEELCKEMNTNITSLQTIVSVIQENDVITGITPIEKGGKVVGYTISFDKHEPITIYNGEDGKDGANGVDGKDGYTPILGVAKDTDGVYYWTLDGEWLLDAEGNKLRVTGRDGKDGIDGEDGKDGADGKDGQDGQDGKDGVDGADGKDGQDGTNGTNGADGKDGVTPQLKIEEGYWYISYDNGATWTELGKAVGEDGQNGTNGTNGKDGQDGDSMFSKVTYDEKNAYLTLADGTVLTIPLGEGVWEKLEDLEERIAELEALCKEMNTNIVALQTIVAALQNNDYITGVAPITKDGKTIGYVISFAKNDPITIYNGEDGKDGANGTNGQDGKDGVDGYTPILGVAKDTDGVYYWTLDGQWLLDADGNKLRVTGRDGKDGQDGQDGKDGVDGEDGKDGVDGEDGIDGENGQNGTNGTNGVDGKDGVTPQLKIENNYWYVSYDKGVTWTELGKAVGEDGKDGIDGEDGKPGTDGKPGKDGVDGDSMFSNVTYDENNVYFILTNGTTLVVPRGNSSTSDFDQTVIDNLVTSLVVDKDIIYLTNIGDKDTIIATTAPFPNSKVIWSSSDTTIVNVNNGIVEAISSGISVISAKAGNLIKEVNVFVLLPNGTLSGIFSVSANKRVRFSKGNLQYQASTGIWRFAEHQYDAIGSQNKNISSTYVDWIDLFGWGTAGYNGKFPYMTSTNYEDYRSFYDWGQYNAISNGGDEVNLWRTLSYSEWLYILHSRDYASILRGVASVNGVNGLILLPDNCILPDAITFHGGVADKYGAEYYSSLNKYTLNEWKILENCGAVFLPAAGNRYGTSISEVGSRGLYWTITGADVHLAESVEFTSGHVESSDNSRANKSNGLSVRLVKDVTE